MARIGFRKAKYNAIDYTTNKYKALTENKVPDFEKVVDEKFAPEFNNAEDLPYIIVPVKGYKTKWSLKDILGSFVEALTDYFSWLDNSLEANSDIQDTVDEILDRYFK